MQRQSKKWKIWVIVTRILGLTLIVYGIYMYVNNIEHTSQFDRFNGVQMQHMTVSLNYVKTIIIGAILLFFREILKYLDYVKYG